MMYFCSTRNKNYLVDGPTAIIEGIAEDGGLYVPQNMPFFSAEEMAELAELPYAALTAKILEKYLPQLGFKLLHQACQKAYASERFGGAVPVQITNLKRQHVLELWHGPTCAFKDMALQLLPHLLNLCMDYKQEKTENLILVATSGDTGKAALAGFSNVPKTKVAVFYPYQGVSQVQFLQMATHQADNVKVCAIEGNFDDTQSGVKNIFNNKALKAYATERQIRFSSANSINIGRLLPQIAYYFWAYFQLQKTQKLNLGQKIDVSVPTGNFGNILAAFYAKEMGLPIQNFICGSNENHILWDFFKTGVYDKRRQFYKTVTPSMDILISSNLERLLFEMLNRDDKHCAQLMKSLNENGVYTLEKAKLNLEKFSFYPYWYNETQTKEMILSTWQAQHYSLDPHTAIALGAAQEFQKEHGADTNPMLVVSTASPYKFANTVLASLGAELHHDEFENLCALQQIISLPIPKQIEGLKNQPIIFNQHYEAEQMPQLVKDWL